MEHIPQFKSSEFLYSKQNHCVLNKYDTEWSITYSLCRTKTGRIQGPLNILALGNPWLTAGFPSLLWLCN